MPTWAYQRGMLGEIIKVPGTEVAGKLVEAGYARTVRALLGSTSTPVISAEPVDAQTRAVVGPAKAYDQ